jgi:hypothetical protein
MSKVISEGVFHGKQSNFQKLGSLLISLLISEMKLEVELHMIKYAGDCNGHRS